MRVPSASAWASRVRAFAFGDRADPLGPGNVLRLPQRRWLRAGPPVPPHAEPARSGSAARSRRSRARAPQQEPGARGGPVGSLLYLLPRRRLEGLAPSRVRVERPPPARRPQAAPDRPVVRRCGALPAIACRTDATPDVRVAVRSSAATRSRAYCWAAWVRRSDTWFRGVARQRPDVGSIEKSMRSATTSGSDSRKVIVACTVTSWKSAVVACTISGSSRSSIGTSESTALNGRNQNERPTPEWSVLPFRWWRTWPVAVPRKCLTKG